MSRDPSPGARIDPISELIQLPGVEYLPVEAVAKAALYTISNILGFTANVLGLVGS